MGLRKVGPDGQRLAVLGDSGIKIVFVCQSEAEAVMGLGIVGLDGQRLAVLGDGAVKVALVV